MSKPKRQHYIPQMILKRFADSGGWLYCCDRTGAKPRFWKTRPKNVFLETHLYTQYNDGGKADGSIEVHFSSLEGAVSPIIDKIMIGHFKDKYLGWTQMRKTSGYGFSSTNDGELQIYALL